MESFEYPQPIVIKNKALYKEIAKLYKEFIYIQKDRKKYLIFPQHRVREDIENFVKFNSK